jgi:hypothetical protein
MDGFFLHRDIFQEKNFSKNSWTHEN